MHLPCKVRQSHWTRTVQCADTNTLTERYWGMGILRKISFSTSQLLRNFQELLHCNCLTEIVVFLGQENSERKEQDGHVIQRARLISGRQDFTPENTIQRTEYASANADTGIWYWSWSSMEFPLVNHAGVSAENDAFPDGLQMEWWFSSWPHTDLPVDGKWTWIGSQPGCQIECQLKCQNGMPDRMSGSMSYRRIMPNRRIDTLPIKMPD